MEVNVLAVCNVLSAYLAVLCGSAVYRLYGCHTAEAALPQKSYINSIRKR
jgi:hypothetical protein